MCGCTECEKHIAALTECEDADLAGKKIPVSERQKDYFTDKNRPAASGRIADTRVFLWITFILSIIIGFVSDLLCANAAPESASSPYRVYSSQAS